MAAGATRGGGGDPRLHPRRAGGAPRRSAGGRETGRAERRGGGAHLLGRAHLPPLPPGDLGDRRGAAPPAGQGACPAATAVGVGGGGRGRLSPRPPPPW